MLVRLCGNPTQTALSPRKRNSKHFTGWVCNSDSLFTFVLLPVLRCTFTLMIQIMRAVTMLNHIHALNYYCVMFVIAW